MSQIKKSWQFVKDNWPFLVFGGLVLTYLNSDIDIDKDKISAITGHLKNVASVQDDDKGTSYSSMDVVWIDKDKDGECGIEERIKGVSHLYGEIEVSCDTESDGYSYGKADRIESHLQIGYQSHNDTFLAGLAYVIGKVKGQSPSIQTTGHGTMYKSTSSDGSSVAFWIDNENGVCEWRQIKYETFWKESQPCDNDNPVIGTGTVFKTILADPTVTSITRSYEKPEIKRLNLQRFF